METVSRTALLLLAFATLLLVVALAVDCHQEIAAGEVLGAGDWRLPSAARTTENRARPTGSGVYAANCIACHQADGKGLPGIFPPLAGSEWLGPENRMVRVILDGLSGPVRVSGAEYNSIMPAFRRVLTDEEIAAVVGYVRQAWGASGPVLRAEEIAAIRMETMSR